MSKNIYVKNVIKTSNGIKIVFDSFSSADKIVKVESEIQDGEVLITVKSSLVSFRVKENNSILIENADLYPLYLIDDDGSKQRITWS